MPTTTMQIRTRRRTRGRKISRRRPRKLSRRQSLSRNGGAPSRYQNSRAGIVSKHAHTNASYQERLARKKNERQIDKYYNNLAKKLLRDERGIVKKLFESGQADEFAQSVTQRVPNLRPNLNVNHLIIALLVSVMSGVDARTLRARVSTTALQNAWDTTDPRRPDEVWSFWELLKSNGNGGWLLNPNAITGPSQDPDTNYKQREEQRLQEQAEADFVEL